MSLKLCTLTGADDNTLPLSEFKRISEKYPFVEWGILFFPKKFGKPRYPSLDWIDTFVNYIALHHPAINTSLHICGIDAINEFIESNVGLMNLPRFFKRIQLNFKQTDIDIEKLKKRTNYFLHEYPDIQIITQHNAVNHDLWQKLSVYKNTAVLFDSSLGKGESPGTWATPLPFVPCGYAGGLGPGNIEEQLSLIDKAAMSQDYWIDMESKLRTLDDHDISQFRFERGEFVLEKIQAFKEKEKGLLKNQFPEGDLSLLFSGANILNDYS